ncbi:Folate-Biopterin Transporter (FBT) Family [Thraustotheca clavata]|uniref:Folate-Biopterin Transporter (FBT) Family n=1 Tax=Thraustotheca clavata TaxID=74557 RepID=A0A1V9YLH1_9STRA|nr:Folate-Biopterin Transporter (FBT) Family [Thraustotheca clavata]
MKSSSSSDLPLGNNQKVWLLDQHQLDEIAVMDKSFGDTSEFIDAHQGTGALREGGAIALTSREALALLSQYAGVGLILGALPALAYPVYNVYLQMEGYQVASYNALMRLPWSLKIFMGIFSDCLPIRGYRRRSYMLIGWIVCGVCCAIMAATPFPHSYYGIDRLQGLPLTNISKDDQEQYMNLSAPQSGSLFIMLSTLAAFGSVLVAVASDAMTVQYAQREPIAVRGRVQTMAYIVRDSFRQLPAILIGFAMNSPRYGGNFSWSLSPNVIYGLMIIPPIFGIFTAVWYLVEEQIERVSWRHYFRSLWHLLQLRVLWQLCAYDFLSVVFMFFDETVSDPMLNLWVHANSLNLQLFGVVGGLLTPVSYAFIGKFALHWEWRSSIVIATFLWVGMRATIQMLAVWNVIRNQYFVLFGMTIMDLPMNVQFLFAAYASVEVADIGNEGVVYALLSSVGNLGYFFGPVLSKTVDSYFAVSRKDLRRDDSTVRWQATYCYLISYFVKIVSLVFVLLLPRQKAHVQLLKRRGESSRLAGTILPATKKQGVWLIDPKEFDMSFSPDTDPAMMEVNMKTPGHYTPIGTESESGIDDGALREGGAVHLGSLEAWAVLSQYAGVGIFLGVFPSMAYPVFQNYLRMQGYQVQSYQALMRLSWCVKIFLGLLSDCCPVRGYRRWPYILLGWVIASSSCAIMAFMPFSAPYYGKASLNSIPLANISQADRDAYINLEAPNSAGLFVLLSALATFGSVMVVCAADGLTVEYAQREPAATRGRFQTAIYVVRDSTKILPQIVVGLCMNSFEYGGHFSWSISPNVIYAALIVPCLACIFTSCFWLAEIKVKPFTLRSYFASLWHLIQLRVVWQLCLYLLLSQVFFFFEETVTTPIQLYWLKMDPVFEVVWGPTGILGGLLYSGVMFFRGKWTLSWDWRWSIVYGVVSLVSIDAVFKLTTVWDAVRNPYYFEIGKSLLQVPRAVVFLSGAYPLVEIADMGNEGAVYALAGTCGNLGVPFGTVLYKTVDSFFHVTSTYMGKDDTYVHWQVSYCYLISFGAKLFSLAFLPLLPRQKAHVQLMKRRGKSSKLAGTIMVVSFVLLLIYSIVTNSLPFNKSTSCLRIAGGSGC